MYCKLFASLYQGTLRGCSDEILVFTNLLAHADMHGNVDKHWRAIAEETGISEDRVRGAITNLEAPDPESRSPEMDGKRIIPLDEHRAWGWQIVNYGKYRSIKNEDDRREKNRLYQERWRMRKKSEAEAQQNQQDTNSVSTRKHSVRESKGSKHMQKQKNIKSKEDTNVSSSVELVNSDSSKKQKRGTRIPDEFFLTDKMKIWVNAECPQIDYVTETKKFCNYWRSTSGQRATKLNWELTWQNWMLNARDRYGDSNGTSYKQNSKSNVTALEQSAEYFERKYGPDDPVH